MLGLSRLVSIVAASAMVAGATVGVAVAAQSPQSAVRGDPSSGAGLARPTEVRKVTPLNSAGRLRHRYDVVAHYRGYCWTSSFLHARAYRCFRGNFIMDPCWKESGRHSVVCLSRPWAAEVTRLRLTRRLPDASGHGGRIWGLRLAGGVGVNCQASSGAGGVIGNRPITFYCRRGWVLVGDPNRNHPRWTIATAKQVGDHYDRRGRKPLVTAWRPVAG